jgi:hypothetical protein
VTIPKARVDELVNHSIGERFEPTRFRDVRPSGAGIESQSVGGATVLRSSVRRFPNQCAFAEVSRKWQ